MAILSFIISLVGANVAFSSVDTVEGHGDAHGHGADSHSAKSIGEDASLVHVSHDEPLDHDDHGHDHPAEPAAAGSRAAELITTGFLLVAAVLSWVVFVDVGFMHH